MKQTPITYSALLAPRINDGSKTQTRRILKHDSESAMFNPSTTAYITSDGIAHFKIEDGEHRESFAGYKCPYGQPGDLLWVREEFYQYGHWEPAPERKRKSGRMAWKFVPDSDEVRYYDNAPMEFRTSRYHKSPQVPAWYKR